MVCVGHNFYFTVLRLLLRDTYFNRIYIRANNFSRFYAHFSLVNFIFSNFAHKTTILYSNIGQSIKIITPFFVDLFVSKQNLLTLIFDTSFSLPFLSQFVYIFSQFLGIQLLMYFLIKRTSCFLNSFLSLLLDYFIPLKDHSFTIIFQISSSFSHDVSLLGEVPSLTKCIFSYTLNVATFC